MTHQRSAELSWRIPTTGDPRLLRIGLAQIGLASVVAALILMVAAPREWLVPALVGLIPLAIFMAYRKWRAFHHSLTGADNVRIDDAGVHWLDATSQQRSFRREEVTAYSIGRDDETLRRVPALTLYLSSGFESQPLELHEPATPPSVRDWLTGRWGLAESEQGRGGASTDYDQAVSVFSECHDDFQEWHWEGTRDELVRFFALIAAIADELPPPPPGAKPMQRTIVASRREPARLCIAHAAVAQFEPDLLAAPAATLRAIANSAAAALADASEPGDAKFDVELRPKNRWTFHLHVRMP